MSLQAVFTIGKTFPEILNVKTNSNYKDDRRQYYPILR